MLHHSRVRNSFTSVFVSCTLCLLTGWNVSAGPAPSAEAQRTIQERIDHEFPELQTLYPHLHTHPELSLHEEQTGARIGEELRKAGLTVTTGVGGYGVVGVLRNGPGP